MWLKINISQCAAVLLSVVDGFACDSVHCIAQPPCPPHLRACNPPHTTHLFLRSVCVFSEGYASLGLLCLVVGGGMICTLAEKNPPGLPTKVPLRSRHPKGARMCFKVPASGRACPRPSPPPERGCPIFCGFSILLYSCSTLPPPPGHHRRHRHRRRPLRPLCLQVELVLNLVYKLEDYFLSMAPPDEPEEDEEGGDVGAGAGGSQAHTPLSHTFCDCLCWFLLGRCSFRWKTFQSRPRT